MKRSGSKASARYQLLVLTSEEKITVCFVVFMLLLGLVTAHYRTALSVPPAITAVQETAKSAGMPAQKRAEARHLNPSR